MTFRSGITRTGERWMSSGTLHERMATPASDERTSGVAGQRAANAAIEQALTESPAGVVEANGLVYEQSASGGHVITSAGSLRHKLAAMQEAEAAAVEDYKRRFNVS
jgi:hypothetical protein